MAKKKVVVAKKKTVTPTASRRTTSAPIQKAELLFGRENYKWMLIGIGLILLGMALMLGGAQPDDNTWDESIIYSWRITVLGPVVIVAGLIIEVYAIFKKEATPATEETVSL